MPSTSHSCQDPDQLRNLDRNFSKFQHVKIERAECPRTGTQDEAFAVFGRSHQACVDGYIGIDLDAAHSQAECLQQLLDDCQILLARS